MLSLIIAEKEQLIPLDRAADRSAVLVLLKRRTLLGKVAFRIKIRIAQELEQGAVKGVHTRLGYDVDQSAAVVSVFRVRVAGQNTKLGNRIEVRNDSRLLADAFLHISAVEGKPIRILALSVD